MKPVFSLILISFGLFSLQASATTAVFVTKDACALDRIGQLTLTLSSATAAAGLGPLKIKSSQSFRCTKFGEPVDQDNTPCLAKEPSQWDAFVYQPLATATLSLKAKGQTRFQQIGSIPFVVSANVRGTGAVPKSLEGQAFNVDTDVVYSTQPSSFEGRVYGDYRLSGFLVEKNSVLGQQTLIAKNGKVAALTQGAKDLYLKEFAKSGDVMIDTAACNGVPMTLQSIR